MSRFFCVCLFASAAAGPAVLASDDAPKHTTKEALQAFNDLIGSWRATGTPEGTAEEKRRGFWTESNSWEWQFKGDDAWLKVAIDKGKYFTGGELHYLPDTDLYRLTLTTPDKETLTFEGPLKDTRGLQPLEKRIAALRDFEPHLE